MWKFLSCTVRTMPEFSQALYSFIVVVVKQILIHGKKKKVFSCTKILLSDEATLVSNHIKKVARILLHSHTHTHIVNHTPWQNDNFYSFYLLRYVEYM